MQPIENVLNKTGWLRTFKPGECRIAQFSSPKECVSFSVILSRWNQVEGRPNGILLSARYHRADSLVEVKAEEIEK